MVEYAFYRDVWAGEMTEQEFAAAERAAAAQLGRYKRIYRVTAPEENSEALAVCAMAEAIHFYEAAENGQLLAGMQLGSLSQTRAAPAPDVSPAAKSRELYRCAGLYLDIRRDEQGVAACG
ncbi:MAG: hypothetical protein SOY27_05745 [Fournierella sp.]|uniref:hypothetical protein n=1 Tax=Allofournierella sp. TaxID=1940256 RepID=UPI002A80DF93|nr:hypothetical protein [Fournierella sp.]MDY4166979.1 hypothetical protein [Fournierella sp.]